MAMEQGKLSDFEGRNIDEIVIDPQGRHVLITKWINLYGCFSP